MALTANDITAQNFKDFYQQIFPYLNKGNGGLSECPLGMTAFFDDTVAPDGWLVADGSVYDIVDYPDLANHYERVHGSKSYWGGNGTTTFAVPDWQGEFLRASGTNSHTNQGSGGAVGEHQDGTVHSSTDNDGSYGASQLRSIYPLNSIINADSTIDNANGVVGTGSATTNLGSSMTSRPTNTSLLLCIKAVPSGDLYNYSTNERRVGTWIDGKPLYQKTFNVPNFSATSNDGGLYYGSIDLTSYISDYDMVFPINDYCFLTMPNNTVRFPIFVEFESGTNIDVFMNSSRTNTTATITLQYTKTTD